MENNGDLYNDENKENEEYNQKILNNNNQEIKKI